MGRFFGSFFGLFVSWWGAFALAALDSSMLFFLPFGIDAVVIFLSAGHPELAWLAPLLATGGSTTGGAVTFWIGVRAGETGLEKLVGERQLAAIQARVRTRGAVLGLAGLIPPPFPLTPVLLVCGALDVNRPRFFLTFGAGRLVRFGVEAALAVRYGAQILVWLKSDLFQDIIAGFVVIALVGTGWSAWSLWRKTRPRRRAAA